MCVFKTWKKSIYMSWNLYHCKNLTSLPWLNDQTQWLIQCKTLLHYEKCELGAFALQAFLNSTYVNCTSNFTCHFNDLDKRHKFCQRLNSTQAIASCANIMYVLKCQKFVLISAIRGSLTCLKTLRVSRLSDSLNVTLSDAIFITGEEGEKKTIPRFTFAISKILFAKAPTTFHQCLSFTAEGFQTTCPLGFFLIKWWLLGYFSLWKTPQGWAELWSMCIHSTAELRRHGCDEHTKRSHGRSMFHIKSH